LLKDTDLIIVNEIEAGEYTATTVAKVEDALEAARQLRRMGPSMVVVTLGEQGVVYVGPEGELRQPAFPVPVIDTTAAGDSFAGGLIAAYLGDHDIQAALQIASAAGAITVTRLGAQTALPDRGEVERFLNNLT
jgi:ribokinase